MTLYKVLQINKKPQIKGEVGLPKICTSDATITINGIDGDYNKFRSQKKNNNPNMAIMILSNDILQQLNSEGWPVKPGDLGENITIDGIDYLHFSPLKKYRIGEAIIEITFICDPCMSLKVLPYVGEKRIKIFMKTLMKRRGWYSKVLQPGEIKTGDILEAM
tara:strand:+ start:1453 stop:1938 length:486 start_codon:yes stop_codon:yes gene_type:complete